MGFPYENANWDAVEGAMYMGANSSWTLVYTLIAAAICVYALWSGNRTEQKKYDNHK